MKYSVSYSCLAVLLMLWNTVVQSFSIYNLLPRSCNAASSLLVRFAATVDPKEHVKLFGRLAETYILLDASGCNCCFSGCRDCEYRLSGGGYRMADQRSARPKWIPNYESRIAKDNTEHTTKWSSLLFRDGAVSLTREEFVQRLVELEYAPPLGGPSVGISSATIDDTHAAEALFDVLSEGKDKLARHKMSLRIKGLAEGEEGLTWAKFHAALVTALAL